MEVGANLLDLVNGKAALIEWMLPIILISMVSMLTKLNKYPSQTHILLSTLPKSSRPKP
jgi:hypothetical protein